VAEPEVREDPDVSPFRGARRYAAFLVAELAAAAESSTGICLRAAETPACASDEPRLWARCGAMALTGDAIPRLAVGAPASCAEGALDALRTLADEPDAMLGLSGASLLAERAAALGLSRAGCVSAGGSCHLLQAADGWLALSLARPDDVALLPAWLESERVSLVRDAWACAREIVRGRPTGSLVERGRLMGLPLAAIPHEAPLADWLRVTPFRGGPAPRGRPPRVVDLSSLWAGPLCTHLLQGCGAEVWKVESSARPDGARFGDRSFYDLLHAGQPSIALDLETQRGRHQLAALLGEADVVVESARPRALRQLGIRAEAFLRAKPGRIWLSISGYGREVPGGDWVAFGDDAAAAAGLLARFQGSSVAGLPRSPQFCGDAIADPLTGLHAAAAVLAFWQRGRSALLDVSLHGVATRAVAAAGSEPEAHFRVRRCANGAASFEVVGWDGVESVASPRLRPAAGRAAELGRDTVRVLSQLGTPC
jgi:hypothetical protein